VTLPVTTLLDLAGRYPEIGRHIPGLDAKTGSRDQREQRDGGGRGQTGPTHQQAYYKTRFCPLFLRGACSYGSKCTYAHSADEIRNRPDYAKTKLCYFWLAGRCTRKSCHFAHGQDELRSIDTSAQSPTTRSQQPSPSQRVSLRHASSGRLWRVTPPPHSPEHERERGEGDGGQDGERSDDGQGGLVPFVSYEYDPWEFERYVLPAVGGGGVGGREGRASPPFSVGSIGRVCVSVTLQTQRGAAVSASAVGVTPSPVAMSVDLGEEVEIMEVDQSGWAYGRKLHPHRSEEGWFALCSLSPIPPGQADGA